MSVIDSLIDQRDAFMRELVQAKQALDAKDARIKELEGALRELISTWDEYDVEISGHISTEAFNRAREALK